jgi:WD40 repeat protein
MSLDRNFRAFISYSHKDRNWGEWLHKAIEGYRIPKRLVGTEARDGHVPRSLFPIFRDREELPSSSNLNQQIVTALENSEYLIVICSPRAAASRWVNEEILAFKRMGRADRILALIVEGTPNADDEPTIDDLEKPGFAAKFGTAVPFPRECLPYALKYELGPDAKFTNKRTEPIAADAREEGDGKEGAKLKLIAGLLGVGYDALRQREHEAQRQRYRKLALGGSTIVAVLSILLALSVVFALTSEATRNTALIAQSKFLARDSLTATNAGDPELGILLALEALPPKLNVPSRPVITEAVAALSQAYAGRQELLELSQPADPSSIRFSPDGRRVLGTAGEMAFIADARSGRTLVKFKGHQSEVTQARFSPDGRRVVTTANDGSALVWDAATGNMVLVLLKPRIWANVRTMGHEALQQLHALDKVRIPTTADVSRLDERSKLVLMALIFHNTGHTFWSAEYSPDGKQIHAYSTDESVGIWDAASGDLVQDIDSGSQLNVIAQHLSADGKYVLTTSWDKAVHIKDAKTSNPVKTFNGHAGVFSRDGLRVISASEDNTASIWDATGLKPPIVLKGHTGEVQDAAFSPDGTLVATASYDHTVRLWDAQKGTTVMVLRGHRNWVCGLDFSPDGRRLVTVSSDGTARIWDITSRSRTSMFVGHTNNPNYAAYSPDQKRVVSTAADGTVRVWDGATGAQLLKIETGKDVYTSVNWSPDGRKIVGGTTDGVGRVWDGVTGQVLLVMHTDGHEIKRAFFIPGGKLIVTGSEDGSIRVWGAERGDLRTTMSVGADLDDLAISSSGEKVVAGLGNGKVSLWNLATGSRISELQISKEPIHSVAFSPDGNRIIAAPYDFDVVIWDLVSGKQVVKIARGRTTDRVAWSPDGALVLVASGSSSESELKVIDAVYGKVLLSFTDITGRSAVFSPDSRHVLATGFTTPLVFDLPPRCQELINLAYRRTRETNRPFTDEERAQYFIGETRDSRLMSVYGRLRPAFSWLLSSPGEQCH